MCGALEEREVGGVKMVNYKTVKGNVIGGLVGGKCGIFTCSPDRSTLTGYRALKTVPRPSPFRTTERTSLMVSSLPKPDVIESIVVNKDKIFPTLGPRDFILSVDAVSPGATRRLGRTTGRRNVRFCSYPLDKKPGNTSTNALAVVIKKSSECLPSVHPILRDMKGSVFLLNPSKSNRITGLYRGVLITLAATNLKRILTINRGTNIDQSRLTRIVRDKSTRGHILAMFNRGVLRSACRGILFDLRRVGGSVRLCGSATRFCDRSSPLNRLIYSVCRGTVRRKGNGLSSSTIYKSV